MSDSGLDWNKPMRISDIAQHYEERFRELDGKTMQIETKNKELQGKISQYEETVKEYEKAIPALKEEYQKGEELLAKIISYLNDNVDTTNKAREKFLKEANAIIERGGKDIREAIDRWEREVHDEMLKDIWYGIILSATTSFLTVALMEEIAPQYFRSSQKAMSALLDIQNGYRAKNYSKEDVDLREDPVYQEALKERE